MIGNFQYERVRLVEYNDNNNIYTSIIFNVSFSFLLKIFSPRRGTEPVDQLDQYERCYVILVFVINFVV